MVSEPVLLEKRDGLAVVTLNRPERMNAVDESMRIRFTETMEALAGDSDAGAVIITAAGDRAFSAGQDIDTAANFNAETISRHFANLGRLYQSIRAIEKPCVVALNGLAAGFGLQVALHADYRVAHSGVGLSQPEIAAGLPSIMGLWVISQAVGMRRAMEMSLTCRTVPAEQALAWGLVDEVVEKDQVTARAEAVARDLAAKPKLAYALSKRRMLEVTQPGYDETVKAAQRIQAEAYVSGEPQRVMQAFLDARAKRHGGR